MGGKKVRELAVHEPNDGGRKQRERQGADVTQTREEVAR
jgi:hypothetical protein